LARNGQLDQLSSAALWERSAALAAYRIYLLDDAGKIANAVDVDCDNDQEALRIAATIAQGGRSEVWQGTRCLGQAPKSHDCDGDGPPCADCARGPSDPRP
jgi:hypothetical protein